MKSLLDPKITIYLLFILSFPCAALSAQGEPDLTILDDWLVYRNVQDSLYQGWTEEALQLLKERAARLELLSVDYDWSTYSDRVHHRLLQIVGPFPERTPLNAKVTGVLEREDFRVEKVLFESIPGFYVTAGLFIPRGLETPAPAVLFCSGHSAQGFRSDVYQTMIINLVKKGFIVFAFDPMGQGERLQYLDPQTGESIIGGPTREHSYPGAQAFLAGISIARYMVWDGIRALDYLGSRSEVDMARIGITGRSGGGTQSAYIAALDDRIKAAAPECYLTTFSRLLQSIGPQDAEQNFFGGIRQGIDLPDLLLARAPKPAMLIATTRDFFSIQGAREAFAEVRRAYEALQSQDKFQMSEDDAPHASTKKNREAMYRFFLDSLDLPGDSNDLDVQLFKEEELYVTKTGQVSSSIEARTIFDLINEDIAELVKNREERADIDRDKTLIRAREISGFQVRKRSGGTVFAGRSEGDGYNVERYYIESPGRHPVPYLLFLPLRDTPAPLVLYLHPSGKSGGTQSGGEVEWLTRKGFAVVSPDLPGIGELGPGSFRGDAYDFKVGKGAYNIWFLGLQIGRSIVGTRAEDCISVVESVSQHPGVDGSRILGLARSSLGTVLLHAAAFDGSIQGVSLIGSLASYSLITENRIYRPELIHSTVAGALPWYDLPELASTLAPRALLVINAIDHQESILAFPEVQSIYEKASRRYREKGVSDSLELKVLESQEQIRSSLGEWLSATFDD